MKTTALDISFAPYAARGRACSGSSSFSASSGVNRGMGKIPASWRASRAGLRDVELTGRHFLSVPGPVAAQRHPHATIHAGNKPQRACRSQDQTQRIGPDDALPLATLVLAQAREGVGVTDGNFHRPAVAIFGKISSGLKERSVVKKASRTGGGFLWPRRVVARVALRRTTTTRTSRPGNTGCHSPHQAWISAPASLGWGATLWRSAPGSWASQSGRLFCAGHRDAWGRGRRQLVELGADGKAPHDMRRLGQPTDIVLGGIATVSQAPDGPVGQLLGKKIEDVPGQLAPGPVRHVEWVGLRFFEIEFAPDWDAEAVARPTPAAGCA